MSPDREKEIRKLDGDSALLLYYAKEELIVELDKLRLENKELRESFGFGDIRDSTAYKQLEDALQKCQIDRDRAIDRIADLREDLIAEIRRSYR